MNESLTPLFITLAAGLGLGGLNAFLFIREKSRLIGKQGGPLSILGGPIARCATLGVSFVILKTRFTLSIIPFSFLFLSAFWLILFFFSARIHHEN